ncbi:MAG: BON domain-containing protein [Pyrinomonadaceae bacterium]|nr:BON domain-containing protein [Pyrinomonadaceae bacterium]
MANRYNDQDYPRYYERDDRYDSRTESGNRERNRRPRNERSQQSDGYDNRNSFGSDDDINFSNRHQGFASGNFGSDFGRGYSSTDRDSQDFVNYSSPRRGFDNDSTREKSNDRNERNERNYSNDRDRNERDRNDPYLRNEGDDYTLYYKKENNDDRSRSFASGNHNHQPQNRDAFDNQGGGYSQQRNRNYDQEQRGWWDRTSDELASWFGDDDASRRRRGDEQRENYSNYEATHRGRGPKNYKRNDERIKEDLNDKLTDYAYLDASEIDVEVNNGEVILTGTVESRHAKRMAEDIADNVSGVNHVENRLRVAGQKGQSSQNTSNQNTLKSVATNENTPKTDYSTGSTGMTSTTENTSNSMDDAIKNTDTTTLGLNDATNDKSKSSKA